MIEFESKIKGIAVPVPFNGWAPGNYQNKCWLCEKLFIGDKFARMCLDCAVYVIDINFEIIGLTSDILKSDELAKRIVNIDSILSYWDSPNDESYMNYIKGEGYGHCDSTDSFQSLLDKYNIVGENLILKRL